MQLDVPTLKEVFASFKPNARRICGKLIIPEPTNVSQHNTVAYQKKFINELDDEKLGLFLRFCTGF